MTNTLTSVTLVNSLTDNDFASGSITSSVEVALSVALVYCEAIKAGVITKTGSDWTDYIIADDGEAFAVALLAQSILLEGRKVTRSRTENVTVRTTDKLFTEEMKNMLISPDAQNEDTVGWINDAPTEAW